jgi:hypothetical protein
MASFRFYHPMNAVKSLVAVAFVAALGATPAMARDDMTDLDKCELAVSKLNMREQQDCKNYMLVIDGLRRTLEEARATQGPIADARERARARAAENLKKGLRPGGFEVCGPDHWQRDHWEPSCR